MKKKTFAIIVILLVSILIFATYIIFLSDNKEYSFVPFVLGTLMSFAIYTVKNIDSKPQELDLSDSDDIENNNPD